MNFSFENQSRQVIQALRFHSSLFREESLAVAVATAAAAVAAAHQFFSQGPDHAITTAR